MVGLRHSAIIALGVLFWTGLASQTALSQAGSRPRTTTFTSPAGDFQFQYPASLIKCEHARDEDWRPSDSCMAFVPICSGLSCSSKGTIACIAYPKEQAGKNTNFEGAAFTVNVVKEAANRKKCLSMPDPPAYGPSRSEAINGKSFTMRHVDGIATGHDLDGKTYRIFRQNTCYELDIRITASNPGISDPPPSKFDSEAVQNELKQVLQSFTFLK